MSAYSEELKDFFKSLPNKHCAFTGLSNPSHAAYGLHKSGALAAIKGPRFVNLGAAVCWLESLSADPDCPFGLELAQIIKCTKSIFSDKAILKAQCAAAKKIRAGVHELKECVMDPEIVKSLAAAVPAVKAKAAASPKTKRMDVVGVAVEGDKPAVIIKKAASPKRKAAEISPASPDKPVSSPKKPRKKVQKLVDTLRDQNEAELEEAILKAVAMAQ
jgi:hypothetical protein